MLSSFQAVNASTREKAQPSFGSVNTQTRSIHFPSTGRQVEDSSNTVSSPSTKQEAASTQTNTSIPPSTPNESNTARTQGVTLAANQPSSPKRGLHNRVSRAKADFAEYLQTQNIPRHFLSINSPNGPLRRIDGDWITSEAWANHIHDNFVWDEDSNQWRLGSNGIIVTEDQIYAAILSYQRALPRTNDKALFSAISRSVEGVQWRDVKKARQLWKEHRLGSLNMADDSLWGEERRAVSECT